MPLESHSPILSLGLNRRDKKDELMRLPLWSWAVALLGMALIVIGRFVEDGTYWQALAIQLGTVLLLFLPIAFAEQSITTTVSNRFRDIAAITRTEQFYLAEEVVRHFGQSLGKKTPPASTDHLGRILGAEGWKPGKVRDGYQMWSKDAKTLAIPVDKKSLGRAVIFGACRYARLDVERYVELWNATRSKGTEPYVATDGPFGKGSITRRKQSAPEATTKADGEPDRQLGDLH